MPQPTLQASTLPPVLHSLMGLRGPAIPTSPLTWFLMYLRATSQFRLEAPPSFFLSGAVRYQCPKFPKTKWLSEAAGVFSFGIIFLDLVNSGQTSVYGGREFC